MSSNKRWDTDEKIKLMKAFSEGKSFDEIGKLLNRSANAIKLRLESIVYDNLVNGKSIDVLTRMLHTSQDNIKQLYYSHKSFLQARGEEIIDVDFTKNIKNDINPTVNLQQLSTKTTTTLPVPMSGAGNLNEKLHQGSGSRHRSKLEKLEKENHAMEQVIKNYKMKRQLRKLYLNDKLDEKSAIICDRILKQSE